MPRVELNALQKFNTRDQTLISATCGTPAHLAEMLPRRSSCPSLSELDIDSINYPQPLLCLFFISAITNDGVFPILTDAVFGCATFPRCCRCFEVRPPSQSTSQCKE